MLPVVIGILIGILVGFLVGASVHVTASMLGAAGMVTIAAAMTAAGFVGGIVVGNIFLGGRKRNVKGPRISGGRMYRHPGAAVYLEYAIKRIRSEG